MQLQNNGANGMGKSLSKALSGQKPFYYVNVGVAISETMFYLSNA